MLLRIENRRILPISALTDASESIQKMDVSLSNVIQQKFGEITEVCGINGCSRKVRQLTVKRCSFSQQDSLKFYL